MMRKILTCTLIMAAIFTMTSYAGQWKEDSTGWRYLTDDGSYKKGWHQDIDGKWYYLDDQSGYMLTNTVTPDGYTVRDDGVWEEEKNMTQTNNKNYDNKTDLEITAYISGPKRTEEIGYRLPVTVYYNNEYNFEDGRKVTIDNIEISKEGILYVKYTMNKETFYYDLKAVGKYILEDGSCVEQNASISAAYFDSGSSAIRTLIRWPLGLKSKPVSAEVFIDIDK